MRLTSQILGFGRILAQGRVQGEAQGRVQGEAQQAWGPPKFYLFFNIHISKGLQCALTAITIVALWRLLHLGRRMCAYTLFGLRCEVTRVLKLQTVSDA